MSEEKYVDYVKKFDESKIPRHKAEVFDEPRLAEFGRLINVGHGMFPRVLLINGTFYVFVGRGGHRGAYYVRGFNEDWQFTSFEKRLTPPGVLTGDVDLTFDGEHIYIFEYKHVRKFDTEFNLVKEVVLSPDPDLDPNEFVSDQSIEFIKGKIYVGTEYREKGELWTKNRPREMENIPPNPEVDRAMHLRIYDTNLNLLEERNLVANVEGAVVPNQYWAIGATQLYADGYYCVVAHVPIGNTSYFKSGESIGARQIFVLRFDDEFNFVDSKGPLSDTSRDNFWCMKSWYEDGRYYIIYMCITKGCIPGPGIPMPTDNEENLRLGIFDEDFNELETVEVTPQGGGLPNILKVGNKLYIAYTAEERNSFVRELILKD